MSLTQNIARAKTDYDDVYEAGKKSQYDEFWDGLQQNGARSNYEYAFLRWVCPKIESKYPIRSTSLYWLCIYNTELLEAPITEPYDAEGYTTMYSAFASCSKMTKAGDFKLTPSATGNALDRAFRYCYKLKTIGTITVNPSLTFNNTFEGCIALEEVRFAGTIGKSIDFSTTEYLSKASIISIFDALSTTVSGQSVGLTYWSVDKAFETEEGYDDGTESQEWLDLVATKPNWTITLS